jgi:hypothetical protein
MDNFLSELLNPGAIVRTIILGVLMIFITKVINRYLSYRSVKSIQRKIKEVEARKAMTEDLATSERFVMLFSFKVLFTLLALASLAYLIPPLISFIVQGNKSFINILVGLLWTSVFGVSVIMSWYLDKAENYPKSMANFDKQITNLRTKLSKPTSQS